MEIRNPDGTSRVEHVQFRFRYRIGQFTSSPEVEINPYDLAQLVETVGAPNFESIGIKLTVKLTLASGEEKMGEIELPESIRKASPSELRAIGDNSRQN